VVGGKGTGSSGPVFADVWSYTPSTTNDIKNGTWQWFAMQPGSNVPYEAGIRWQYSIDTVAHRFGSRMGYGLAIDGTSTHLVSRSSRPKIIDTHDNRI
jgi:hypothetical protein